MSCSTTSIFNWTLRSAGEKISSGKEAWTHCNQPKRLVAQVCSLSDCLFIIHYQTATFYSCIVNDVLLTAKIVVFSDFDENLIILNKNLHIFQHGQEAIFSLSECKTSTCPSLPTLKLYTAWSDYVPFQVQVNSSAY